MLTAGSELLQFVNLFCGISLGLQCRDCKRPDWNQREQLGV